MHPKPLYNDACYTNADLMFAYDKVLEDYQKLAESKKDRALHAVKTVTG